MPMPMPLHRGDGRLRRGDRARRRPGGPEGLQQVLLHPRHLWAGRRDRPSPARGESSPRPSPPVAGTAGRRACRRPRSARASRRRWPPVRRRSRSGARYARNRRGSRLELRDDRMHRGGGGSWIGWLLIPLLRGDGIETRHGHGCGARGQGTVRHGDGGRTSRPRQRTPGAPVPHVGGGDGGKR